MDQLESTLDLYFMLFNMHKSPQTALRFLYQLALPTCKMKRVVDGSNEKPVLGYIKQSVFWKKAQYLNELLESSYWNEGQSK